jgi:hypothetical protein
VTPLRAGLIIASAAVIFGAANLSRYGLTSDSPSLFYSGDRTLFWLQHLDQPGALDLLASSEPKGFRPEFQRFPDIKDPVHYPVLPGFVAAVVSWVFHTKLGWLNHIDGHHLGLVLLHGLGLLLFCLYSCKLLGRGAGIAATVALALFPTGVGHAPNNAKDWPCAELYGLAILAAGVGIVQGRLRHLIASALFIGLGLSAKLNAAFVFPTLLLWIPAAWLLLFRGRKKVPARVVAGCMLAPLIAFLVFFVAWPWLYYGAPSVWIEHLREYVRFMSGFGVGQRPGFTAFPFKAAVLMSPPLVLLSAFAYLAFGWRGSRERAAVASLLFIWLALPLLRIAMPRSNFYDANRHFIEYVPALCALAGAGAAWFGRALWSHLSRGPRPEMLGGRLPIAGTTTAGLIALGSIIWPIVEYHPYETTYFNFLVGGLGGAQRSGLFAMGPPSDIRVNGTEGDYWFSSARDGFRDLKELNSERGVVGLCGPGRGHALFNIVDEPKPRFAEVSDADFRSAKLVYISPRESLCWWREIRRYESERPVIKRVERGGGLIYEILGAKDGVFRIPPSRETWYERHPDPRDKYSYWRYEPQLPAPTSGNTR